MIATQKVIQPKNEKTHLVYTVVMFVRSKGRAVVDAADRGFHEGVSDAARAPAHDHPAGGDGVALRSCRGDADGRGFTCRLPTPSDAPFLASLWAEMQQHYGEPVGPSAAEAAAAFACREGPATEFDPRIVLAVAEAGTVMGALALNVTFPAGGLTRSLYIRDLYVAANARRGGVARNLLRKAAALTLSGGFSSLDWTADARNADARRFYEREGAARVARVYFRLEGKGLLRAAGF